MKNIQSLMFSKVKRERPVLPQHLNAQKIDTQPIPMDSALRRFEIGQGNFGKYSTASEFKQLQSQLIEIDVEAECRSMTEDSFLEITMPVLGLMDLMRAIEFFSPCVLHPSFVSINGFGAKESSQDSFPQVDFIRVLDIADSRYEIMLTPEGKLELPEQGLGLFSIIKEITFVLGYRQVVQGLGLTSLESVGAQKGKLYLLPPLGTDESFTFYVCLTHIDEINRRLVDSIRSVNVNFSQMPLTWKVKEVTYKPQKEDPQQRNTVSLSLTLESVANLARPLLLNVITQPSPSHPIDPLDLNGWSQHPIHPSIFSKRFGLSQMTLMLLIQDAYTEFDYMRDYLIRNPVPLSQEGEFNNFLLRPEVFVKLYQSLVHDLARGYITGEFLLSRIVADRFTELDILDIPVDFHDSVVMQEIQTEFANGRFDTFAKLFNTRANPHSTLIQDSFYLANTAIANAVPKFEVEVVIEEDYPKMENAPILVNSPNTGRNRPK